MDGNINDVFSNGDEALMRQFEAIEKLSESEVRLCAKKAYADLKEAHLMYYRLEEEKDNIIKELHASVRELEIRIETHNKKWHELFDV